MLLGSESAEKKRLSPGASCSTSAIYVGGLKDTEALFQQVGLQADQLAGQLYARQAAMKRTCCLAGHACLSLSLTIAAAVNLSL